MVSKIHKVSRASNGKPVLTLGITVCKAAGLEGGAKVRVRAADGEIIVRPVD